MPIRRTLRLLGPVLAALLSGNAAATDWPQLQADAARTGRTVDSVAPPYRARWIWLGPSTTLRNRNSASGWPDDLTPRDGYSYPVPASVPFTLGHWVQPVVAAGKVFVGTMEGNAYGINANDGSTAWSASLPGGTIVTAAVEGGIAVFAGLTGTVYGLRTTDGSRAWAFRARKAITTPPAVSGGKVYVASHDGYVYCLDAATGARVWRSERFAPIQGGLAVAGGSVFVGAEDMSFYALDAATGAVRAKRRLRGQSFRMLHPVVAGNQVLVQTASVPAVGSEYVMETLMAGSGDFATEEANIARWLTGDTNGGAWPDASTDWQHLFALSTADLSEPFKVLCGPVDGVGQPATPPCLDNAGRVLTWWKTRFPTLTKVGAFGTAYSLDIAGINLTNGHRVRIDNGRLSNMWPGPETDNLYALSVGGDYVWLRQQFRGTQNIQLSTSNHRFVSAQVRHQDGGNFLADVVYVDQLAQVPATASRPTEGRIAPVISGNLVFIAESFGITAIEHAP